MTSKKNMKITKFLAMLFCVVSIGYGQEIPSGVRYKTAPDELNNLSKELIQIALSSKAEMPSEFFGDVFVAGPTLWKALKPQADPILIGARSLVLIIPGKSSFAAEAKAIRTDDEKKAFWKQFKSHYSDLANASIRKARAEEISYYWATIPFDIEEPFWVIERGSDRFIADFESKGGKARLFWIDLVSDLEKLRPK